MNHFFVFRIILDPLVFQPIDRGDRILAISTVTLIPPIPPTARSVKSMSASDQLLLQLKPVPPAAVPIPNERKLVVQLAENYS
jgi:hypothetical protein